MTDIRKIAEELVSVLPEEGGTRQGMYYDIIHALEAYAKSTELRLKLMTKVKRRYQEHLGAERQKLWEAHARERTYREALETLNNRGGLGLDIHAWLTAILKDTK